MEAIHSLIGIINNFLYQPFIVPLFLLGAGVYLSIRFGFPQLRLLREAVRATVEKPQSDEAISSFGALMVSTASRVGTGNIVGVSTAICLGGPGAVFWMWVTAVFGAASGFVEATLAQIYKHHDENGKSFGGPSYYIQDALGQRWLGIIFSIFILLTYLVGYNLLASFNIQSAFSNFGFYNASTTPMAIGVILAILFALSIFGGLKSLTRITGVLVPVMGVVYVLFALFVMLNNVSALPHMFSMIFTDAFTIEAGFGGLLGSCIMWGIKRGLYSNEAGMGSAPNASASASVSHPVKQGMVQILSVFIDTLVICSATAFMCLSTGVEPTEELSGIMYVQACLETNFGPFGPIFIACAMALFGFTTLIGNYYYTEGCLRFILNRKPDKVINTVFRSVATVLVFIGAVSSAGLVWDLADMCQGLMVVVNIPAILILSPIAFKALKDYETQLKAGTEPRYVAKNCGVKQNTDFWK